MGKKGKKKTEGAGQQQQPAKQGQKKTKEEPKDPSGYAQAMAIPELEEEMEGLEVDEENNDLQPGETGCDQEQSVTPASATILTAAASTVASNHRHSSLLEPVRIAWREEEKESQTVNITNSPRQSRSRSQVHETRSRFCTIS